MDLAEETAAEACWGVYGGLFVMMVEGRIGGGGGRGDGAGVVL